MEIIRHIKVDLYGDTQHFAVAAKQMDMGTRYIGVTLMEDGVVYEIPDNVEVIINMTKPDKTHVHNDRRKVRKRGSHSSHKRHVAGSRNSIVRGAVISKW